MCSFWSFILILVTTGVIQGLDKGIYHILNLEDGSWLESQNNLRPTDLGKNGVFTNDLKYSSPEQLWKVEIFGGTDRPNDMFSGYQLNNEKNRNNEVSDSKPDPSAFFQSHFYELILVSNTGIYNIRSKSYKKCLVNWGLRNRIGWWPDCEAHSKNQQWKFIRVA